YSRGLYLGVTEEQDKFIAYSEELKEVVVHRDMHFNEQVLPRQGTNPEQWDDSEDSSTGEEQPEPNNVVYPQIDLPTEPNEEHEPSPSTDRGAHTKKPKGLPPTRVQPPRAAKTKEIHRIKFGDNKVPKN